MAATERKGKRRGIWLVGGVAVIIVAIVAALFFNSRTTSARTTVATSAVTRGKIIATVTGSGTVVAAQSLDLNFQTSGIVTEVLVKEGDSVKTGQVLARIDSRDLQSQVDSAQANLDSVKAQLAQSQQGNATPQDIAAQKAQLANAQATLQKTRQGSYTAADVADAQAQLRSAQAQLAALQHPAAGDLSAAQQKVRQAEITVQSTRDSKSQAKTAKQIAVTQSGDALTKAQATYSKAKSDWDYVQQSSKDPSTAGQSKQPSITDVGRAEYYATFVQAEASLRSAEKDVENAQVSFDLAQQDEVTSIQTAESQLADAQVQLVALQKPDSNAIVQKQAAVEQARANLAKVQQGGTKADIAASQATVAQQQANLAKLTEPATATDLQVKQASVAQAEQSLKQAQLNLDETALKAPFNGIITTVNIVPGSGSSGNSASDSTTTTAAMSLINRDPLHVDLKLSENDVAKVQLGQKVDLTIDALPEWKVQGTVSYIASSAETSNDVVTYRVRVDFPGDDAQVKVGMTANLTITTATRENVLLVPNTTLQPKGAGRVVLIPNADGSTREVEVQTGLTDGTDTEIISGLTEGANVVTTPDAQTKKSGGLFGG